MSRERSTARINPSPSAGMAKRTRISAITGSEPAGTPAVAMAPRLKISITVRGWPGARWTPQPRAGHLQGGRQGGGRRGGREGGEHRDADAAEEDPRPHAAEQLHRQRVDDEHVQAEGGEHDADVAGEVDEHVEAEPGGHREQERA